MVWARCIAKTKADAAANNQVEKMRKDSVKLVGQRKGTGTSSKTAKPEDGD